ncbi:MAG TPA: RdgB/HAM1 family non-canonical purine NTP pyrophosphatase [Thermohalobaculum sp.]|nr:RdgB/HAM1 family non-canonical purine NTP pyrophosphatase [Thermohalobaculum sp.]
MTRRFESQKLVVASHNAGKVREIAELLAPFRVETVSAAELGLPEPEETEESFEGNARLKARAAAEAANLPALADDSGLVVAALDGAPGIHSARWAEGEGGRDFARAIEKVHDALPELEAHEPYRAAFHCALALAWPDGHAEVFLGEVKGRLVFPPRGEKGFGYDPIFLPDRRDQTFGEMEPEEKHRISHRAHAFRQMIHACFGRWP